MKYFYAKFLLLAGFLATSNVHAQSIDANHASKPRFKLDFTLGPNVDIPPASDKQNLDIFGSRPAVAPFLGIRATHLFADKIGWYAGIDVSYYKEIKPTGYKQSGLETFFDNFANAFFGPISYVKPAVNLGLLYQIETAAWSFYPSLGFGHQTYLGDKNIYRSKTNSDGVNHELTYARNASQFTAHIGLSTNYYVSRRSYLAFNASFRQPLQDATSRVKESADGAEISRTSLKSSEVGRGVLLGIGFGMALGKML